MLIRDPYKFKRAGSGSFLNIIREEEVKCNMSLENSLLAIYIEIQMRRDAFIQYKQKEYTRPRRLKL